VSAASKYQSFAVECLKLAAEAKTEQERAALLSHADQWTMAALTAKVSIPQDLSRALH
jgi:hypothetical protein